MDCFKVFLRPIPAAFACEVMQMKRKRIRIILYVLIVVLLGVFGYSVMSLVLDEAGIDNLAVLPGHRRSGAGSALLSQMLSDARMLSAESAVLEVRESNTPAIALYERFGFQQVGFRKNYYENPTEGAKLYSLRLS